MSAASKAAAVLKTSGAVWQERPVKPPAYTPTAKQVEALYLELLAKVVEARPNETTGLVYDHALSRGLRVVRLTKPEEPAQRFMFQAQTGKAGAYENVEIVDAEGNTAEWTPPPKVVPVSKAELQAVVDELKAELAELKAAKGGG